MNLQERQQFWQQQVNTWQTTGLSGAAFCKQQGLNYSSSIASTLFDRSQGTTAYVYPVS